MGLMDTLFGNTDPNRQARNDYWNQLGSFDSAYQQAFGPEAWSSQLGDVNQRANTDFNNLRAAGNNSFGSAGFGASNPTYDLAQSQFTAAQAAALKQRIMQQRLAAIAQRAQLAAGAPSGPTSGGILGPILQAYGMMKGGGASNSTTGTTNNPAMSPGGGFSTTPGLPYQGPGATGQVSPGASSFGHQAHPGMATNPGLNYQMAGQATGNPGGGSGGFGGFKPWNPQKNRGNSLSLYGT